jgi:hypothetical protein
MKFPVSCSSNWLLKGTPMKSLQARFSLCLDDCSTSWLIPTDHQKISTTSHKKCLDLLAWINADWMGSVLDTLFETGKGPASGKTMALFYQRISDKSTRLQYCNNQTEPEVQPRLWLLTSLSGLFWHWSHLSTVPRWELYKVSNQSIEFSGPVIFESSFSFGNQWCQILVEGSHKMGPEFW